MKDLNVIGIDIAKNFLQIHGTNRYGKAVLKKRLSREKFFSFMANLPKCLVGMEACGGAHYLAKRLLDLGFDVKLMSPRKVKMYVDNHKNDANDAAACAEAAIRESIKPVPIKTDEQIEIQAMHRLRSHYVKEKTALMNMTRGVLQEMGIKISQGEAALKRKLKELCFEENNNLTQRMKIALQQLYANLIQLNEQIDSYKSVLETLAKKDGLCVRIATVPGIGPITATAVVAKIGNASEFQNGRELSAYLGLVPKQHSSGDKQVLGRISKHGDRYVRQLLVHGGRSAVKAALKVDQVTKCFLKTDEHSRWMRQLVERVGYNKAAVAVANKNARILVAMLKSKTNFDPQLAH
jgi:transposase